MLLVNHFKFFDYEQSPIMFYLKCMTILIAIALIIYSIFALVRKLKERKVKK